MKCDDDAVAATGECNLVHNWCFEVLSAADGPQLVYYLCTGRWT